MTTWVLVLVMWVAPEFASSNKQMATSVIEGFETKSDCERGGATAKSVVKSDFIYVQYACIPQAQTPTRKATGITQ